MPIYAYRCAACGHAQDLLRKISDPVLTVCPACGADAFQKQVTAAGFQLKGSGWYVTDFRGGDNKGKGGTSEPGGEGAKGDAGKVASTATAAPSASGASSEPAAPAAKPVAAAPSSGSGTGSGSGAA